jgi:hypothetical protein
MQLWIMKYRASTSMRSSPSPYPIKRSAVVDSLCDVLDPKLRAALTATGMRTERMDLFGSSLQGQISAPGDRVVCAILS